MAKRLARKVKRSGKEATQFKFTSTFEYIDFDCVGTWKPENLRVIWLRSHRRVESTSVQFVTTEDRGPKGSSGRAVFDPALSVSLVVTLYRDAKSSKFDEKEYKYYLEHDGAGGRKILASFTCDMSEYIGMPSSKHALEMNFKCVSKKISKAVLGITLSCEFIKDGKATDDDMQSTFSAVDPANEEMIFADEDEDDEDNLDEAATLGQNRKAPSDAADSGPSARNPFDDEPDQQEGSQPPAQTTPTKTVPSELETSPSHGPPPSKVESSGELASGVSRMSVKDTWLPDAEFVDCHDITTSCDRVDRADVIGLYFSAQWCPPCRRFLPKLIKFYNGLRENDKSFEIIYVSNDNTRSEMIQYMQLEDHPMPWLAFPHGHKLVQKLKEDFKVSSIPLLVIVNHEGELLDSNAKKTVEGASSTSSAVKEYTKWIEKNLSSSQSDDEVKQKKGIFKQLKNKLLSKDENDEAEPPPKQHERSSTITEENANIPTKDEREMAESKVHVKQKSHGGNSKDELMKQLKHKDETISHLEEVNMSLDQTNKDLNQDIQELKNKVTALEAELDTLKETSARREAEDERFRETLKLQGWLFKRGIKGPTASVWRKRYFKLDQGSKLTYYKTQAEGTPQGFIDLIKVVGVSEVSPAQQDKNNASFNISCEGRTYQLQAYDEATMRRWISAIEYLKDFYQKQEGASP